MTKRNKINFLLLSIILIYIIIYQTFLLNNTLKYIEFINASFLIVLTFIGIKLLGIRSEKTNYLRKNIVTSTITLIILYFAISYGLGLFLGYKRNSYALDLNLLINNVFGPIIVVILIEILRYIIIRANKDNKLIIIMSTIIICLLDIFIHIKISDFISLSKIFEIITLTVLPIITKNITLSYLTYHAGYLPGIIYRLTIDIYIYIIPLMPNFGDYINSSIGILFPIILFMYTSRIVDEYYNKVPRVYIDKNKLLTDWPFIVILLLFGMIISGVFPIYLLAIGSGSMTPILNKSDGVLIYKIKDKDKLKEGDIIAYKNEGKVIIHRIVEITKENNIKIYHTKGDANNSVDKVDITEENIKGKVICRIPYIAYPRILLKEIIG